MNDRDKTRKQLLDELVELRERVSRLESEEIGRREAENALRESEERHRTVADLTYDWEYWLDQRGSFKYVSPSCERITGYSADEFLRDPGLLERIIHPDDRAKTVAHLQSEAISGGTDESCGLDFRIVRRDGGVRWIGHECRPVRMDDGRKLGTRGSHRDITERMAAEAVVTAQRDLGVALNGVKDFDEAFRLCVDTALEMSGMDAAGVYLVTKEEGLQLVVHRGVSREYASEVSYFDHGSRQTLLMISGVPVYSKDRGFTPVVVGLMEREGLKSVAILPVMHEGEILACFCLASRVHEEISDRSRHAMEAVVAQLGNVVARLRSEKALLESREQYRSLYEKAEKEEELFRSLLNSSPDAIVIYDMAGHVRYLNRAHTEIFGWSLEEVQGKRIPYLPAWDRETTKSVIDRIVKQGEPQSRNETQRLTKDGRVVDVSLSVSRCHDHEGNPAGTLVILTDITQRKRSEAKLLQMSKVYMEAIDPILIRDLDGILIDVNEATEATYGWTREELLGKSFKTTVPPERHARADELQQRCKSGEKVRNVEAMRLTKSGEMVPVLLSLSLLTDGNGKPVGIASITQNLTDLKRTEQMLRERTIALEESNRDLEQFAYMAAHDLREPLLAVSAYVKILQRRYKGKLDEDADKFIALAVDATIRMDQLIRSLLEYSRLGSDPPKVAPADCGEALERALSNLHAVVEESGALVKAGPLPTVMGNVEQLAQLFQNLVSNAMKFAGNDRPEIEIGSVLEDGEHRFWVKDNGIGIEPHETEKIFRIFQRVQSSSSRPGSGIGLANCKKIVERHGGRIWVESAIGAGSTFFFTVPDRVLGKD